MCCPPCSLDRTFAIFLLKKPTLRPPRLKHPFVGEELDAPIQWRPYPRSENTQPLYGKALFGAYCDLAKIAYEVAFCVPFSRNEDEDTPEELLSLLHTWHDDLPEHLRAYPEQPGPLFELQ